MTFGGGVYGVIVGKKVYFSSGVVVRVSPGVVASVVPGSGEIGGSVGAHAENSRLMARSHGNEDRGIFNIFTSLCAFPNVPIDNYSSGVICDLSTRYTYDKTRLWSLQIII